MFKKRLTALLALTMIAANGISARAEGIKVPADVVEISEDLGRQYNICPELIQAICWKESRFESEAESEGCVGIMQVSPKWHKDRMARLGITDLFNVRENMTAGVDYFSELIGNYEDVSIALMIYNGDSSANDVLSGSDEVSAYADEILAISAELERENGK